MAGRGSHARGAAGGPRGPSSCADHVGIVPWVRLRPRCDGGPRPRGVASPRPPSSCLLPPDVGWVGAYCFLDLGELAAPGSHTCLRDLVGQDTPVSRLVPLSQCARPWTTVPAARPTSSGRLHRPLPNPGVCICPHLCPCPSPARVCAPALTCAPTPLPPGRVHLPSRVPRPPGVPLPLSRPGVCIWSPLTCPPVGVPTASSLTSFTSQLKYRSSACGLITWA